MRITVWSNGIGGDIVNYLGGGVSIKKPSPPPLLNRLKRDEAKIAKELKKVLKYIRCADLMMPGNG